MRSLARRICAGLCVGCIGLLGASGVAVAEKAHVYSSSFGEAGSGPGQLTEPSGVAVNDSTDALSEPAAGDVYVVDKGNDRVERFSSTGTYLGQFEAPSEGFVSPESVAVDDSGNPLDPSAYDVYVVNSGHDAVDKFSPEGKFLEALTESAVGVKFEELGGVAVDQTGELWVDQRASKEVFNFSDAAMNVFIPPALSIPNKQREGDGPGFAVDTKGDFYIVKNAEPGAVVELDSSGTEIGAPQGEAAASGIAVDLSSDDAYVDNLRDVAVLSSAGSMLEAFGSEQLADETGSGIAVNDSNETVYVADRAADDVNIFNNVPFPTVRTGSASEVDETAVTLHGTVNPEGEEVTACEFEYGPATANPGEYPNKVACTPAAPFVGSEPVNVSTRVTGLESRHVYHYRLTAANVHGVRDGNDESTFTVSGPLVESESTSIVGSTDATVGARVDAAGLSTTYSVEYGTSEDYGHSTPAVSIGAPTEAVSVSAQLTGLTPGVEYHFRFVATSALGIMEGGDTRFNTSASAGGSVSTLPDERAYELVSDSGNEEVYAPPAPYGPAQDIHSVQPFQSAASGGAVTYLAGPPVTGGNGEANQWLAVRSSTGWSTHDISPTERGSESQVYQYFSSDLSTSILQDPIQPPLASGAPAGCTVLYSRNDEMAQFTTLLTGTKTSGDCGSPYFAGASSDDSQTIFQSEAALTQEAEEAETSDAYQHSSHSFLGGEEGEPCQLICNLYDSSTGVLRPVNVLPDTGQVVPNATFGGASEGPPDFSNVISTDGKYVFWTDTQSGEKAGHVYARENASEISSPLGPDGECTVSSEACTFPVSSGAALYWTATPDGRYVFYTEKEQLWRFDTGTQTRVALAKEGMSENAGVQGVIGINQTGEDGEYVYFVATGILASDENGNNESAEKNQDNLYVLHNGVVSFIATLAPIDNALYAQQTTYDTDGKEFGVNYGDWRPSLGDRTAEVAPNGQNIVFESTRPLTGYDNIDGANESSTVEVFVYSADSGSIVCSSCAQNGAAPSIEEGGSDKWTLLPVSFSSGTTMRRWISDDGNRVFFASAQPLVSQDTNGVQDVYEWEREGAPSCPATRPARADHGCDFVLSGGESSDPSFLVDSDSSGDNVFFTTRAQLVPEDRDEATDLYDARVHGGFSQTSLACTGSGCQGVPPASPTFATPASVTFDGAGDFPQAGARKIVKSRARPLTRAQKLAKALKACRRQPKKQRPTCQARARGRYGPRHRPGKATTKRSGKETKRGNE
jgi:hypothetical protein